MRIGIPKESLAGETRVACTPATVAQLLKLGFEVVVEHDAGAGASLNDAAYAAAGAAVADRFFLGAASAPVPNMNMAAPAIARMVPVFMVPPLLMFRWSASADAYLAQPSPSD